MVVEIYVSGDVESKKIEEVLGATEAEVTIKGIFSSGVLPSDGYIINIRDKIESISKYEKILAELNPNYLVCFPFGIPVTG